MSEIDWSKAPEGATHRDPEHRNWLRQFDGASLIWLNGRGWSSHGGQYPSDLSSLLRLEAIPATLAWAGEGMPPAGTLCELKVVESPVGEGNWGTAEIVYSSSTALVWRWQGWPREFGADATDVKCRPFRTPEQIAAEEREKAIHTMVRLMGETDRKMADPHAMKSDLAGAYARALHDAGYRKVEGGDRQAEALQVAIRALKCLEAEPGCGCPTPCQCSGPEWSRAEIEGRMGEAEEALRKIAQIQGGAA